MSHYFTDNRELEKKEKQLPFKFNGDDYTFTTYAGVFSKDAIDYGSFAFVKVLVNQDLGRRMLDLGCGYGTLGIIIKKTFVDLKVVMVDINPRAVELTMINKDNNKVDVNCFVSDKFENVKSSYTSIICNPPIRTGKDNIYSIFKEAYDYLEVNGSLYLVIRKQQGAKSAFKYLEGIYQEVDLLAKDKGYHIIRAKKLNIK